MVKLKKGKSNLLIKEFSRKVLRDSEGQNLTLLRHIQKTYIKENFIKKEEKTALNYKFLKIEKENKIYIY